VGDHHVAFHNKQRDCKHYCSLFAAVASERIAEYRLVGGLNSRLSEERSRSQKQGDGV